MQVLRHLDDGVDDCSVVIALPKLADEAEIPDLPPSCRQSESARRIERAAAIAAGEAVDAGSAYWIDSTWGHRRV